MYKEEQERLLEALLFASPEPLKIDKIIEVCPKMTKEEILISIEKLNGFYLSTKSSFTVSHVAGAYILKTLPEFHELIEKLWERKKQRRLSRSALEVLAIIAYEQPITKAQIDHFRGASCDFVLKSLLQQRYVIIKGRKEMPGSPFLYGTSEVFLEAFGMKSLEELPKKNEFEQIEEGD